MNWLTLAQGIPDAKELADGDAQKVLAYVVAALVLAVLGLFALLIKQNTGLHKHYGVKVSALETKNDAIQERLLRYVANMNTMLAGHTTPSDPLDPNGGSV